ncbi:MAG: hypothetical protein ACFFE8_03505 [Candidatus Heimdallarchaeota archaeon]
MSDTSFYLVQTAIFWVSALICLVITYIVYLRDPNYALNRVFSGGSLTLGLFNIVMGVSNVPVFLFQEQLIIQAVQLAYSALVISLCFFLLSAVILQFGTSFPRRGELLIVLILIILVDIFVIWFTDDAFAPTTILGDVTTSLLFKMVVLGSLALIYLVALILFVLTYRETEADIRRNIGWLLGGWLVGGAALIASAISDFYQPFDLVGPFLLGLALFIMQRGFIRRPSV